MRFLAVILILPLFCFVYLLNAKSDMLYTMGKTDRFLHFDGFYNTYDTSTLVCGKKFNEVYTTKHLVVFLDTNFVYHASRIVSYSMPEFQNEYMIENGTKSIGNYTITGDSIFATIPTKFALNGMRLRYFKTHYSGYIKNADTIIGWKMIPPYPNIKLKLNDFFHTDTAPKLLYFVKYEKVKELQRFLK